MGELLVESEVICVNADKSERHLTIEIGIPCPSGEDFACHAAIQGLAHLPQLRHVMAVFSSD